MRSITAWSRSGSPVALVDEDGDRHAPGALARDAPVGPRLDHGADAVLALRRDTSASRRSRPAPSRAGRSPSMAMNHCGVLRKMSGALRAPGMRIGMDELARAQQPAGVADRRDHRAVGVAGLAVGPIDVLAGEERHVRVIGAVAGHGLRHLDADGAAELEIVGAVAGRDMDEAGAVARR